MSWMHRILQGDVLGLITAWGMHFSEGGGGSEKWTTINGTAPLILEDAVASAIKRLVQFGRCEQDSTPTSSAPIAIKCNNGALTIVDDELPVGYRRITEINFDGNTWYETGEKLNGDDDVTMTLAGTSSTGQNVFGSYNGTAEGRVNFSLFIYGAGSTSKSYFRYGVQLLRPVFGSGQRTITFGKSGTTGFNSNESATPEEFETPANAYIGMLPNSTSPAFTGRIIGDIVVGTRLKWIPCERVADGVIGYYETHNGVFIEPSGTGAPTKGNYDGSHYVLQVVGTPEMVMLPDMQTASVSNIFGVGDYTDTQDIISGAITRRVGIKVLDGTEAWTKTSDNRFTTLFNDAVAGVGNLILCTHYVYNRNVTSTNCCRITDTGRLYICDTFGYSTAGEYKTFLAEQYAAGTPVIVVYPLAEEAEEQVIPQNLSTVDGTNVIAVTAEVSPITLEVKYAYKNPG